LQYIKPVDIGEASMKKLMFFVSVFMVTKVLAQSGCRSHINSCSYYPCVSAELGCSAKNYLVSFGKKYCRVFAKKEEQFSTRGKQFLDRVGNCLRNEIENKFSELNCSNAKQSAARDHVTCYVESGFCELSVWDKYRIFENIITPLLFDGTFRGVAGEINFACLHR
jgi:hypothetical protein